MTERHGKHCDYSYPVDEWHEGETTVQTFGGQTTDILRTVECPGCRSVSDLHACELRDRPTP